MESWVLERACEEGARLEDVERERLRDFCWDLGERERDLVELGSVVE